MVIMGEKNETLKPESFQLKTLNAFFKKNEIKIKTNLIKASASSYRTSKI